MKVGGVPTGLRVDYVTLHLLEGEARTWYDLRVKSVQNEAFETFSTALKEHFTNHNSQRHYRESLQQLHMRQFKDPIHPMEYIVKRRTQQDINLGWQMEYTNLNSQGPS